MSKAKFINHGNSTIKLSAITGVSWEREEVGPHGSRVIPIVTIHTGKDDYVERYDSDELAEEDYDEIVARWEDA